MKTMILGNTGLEVSELGLGAAQLGGRNIVDAEVGPFLNGLLDLGIQVIDTGHCYMNSEEIIGRHLSHRRDEYVLVTKCCSHREPGVEPPWSGEVVRRCAETSLKRLRTDHLDVLLLHTCPEEDLHNDEMIAALQKCKEDGLTRFVGYSGDNETAVKAIDLGITECLETSVSMCDQQVIDTVLPKAREKGVGVLTKRTIAGSCWRQLPVADRNFDENDYIRPYVERLKTMGFTPDSLGFDGGWAELALRFTLAHEGVHVGLIGGTNIEHIRQNIAAAEKGPLPEDLLKAIREAWRTHDNGSWRGIG